MGPRSSAHLSLAFPKLRLSEPQAQAPTPAQFAAARRAIAQENHTAALSANDARWVFAERVHVSIEGGRAAIMRPEARRRLVAHAAQVGLRPFDANLVIAIVQEAARHGEGLDQTAAERLAIVPVRDAAPFRPLVMLALAVGGAAAGLAMLMAWVLG